MCILNTNIEEYEKTDLTNIDNYKLRLFYKGFTEIFFPVLYV